MKMVHVSMNIRDWQEQWFSKKILKILFICQKEREIEHKQREQQVEGEAVSPLSRDFDVGLDPRTPESWPEPKADT